MAVKKNEREFKRLYNNLVEVCRRAYDTEHKYPVQECARWFVNDLHTLLDSEELKSMLTMEHIAHIREMGVNLLRSKLIDTAHKQILRQDVKELKALVKTNLMVGNYSK